MKKTYLLIIFIFVGLSVSVLISFLAPFAKNPSKSEDKYFKTEELPLEIPSLQAQKCGQCHQDSFNEWKDSQHAWANQSLDQKEFSQLPNNKAAPFHPTMQIGLEPLIQYLIPMEGGRLQVFDWAYDPQAKEWFYVFEDGERKEGEWGHWKGRGMNWNSQCAVCHMTGYEKGYDLKQDTYHSTWKEMGISCTQCHVGTLHHPTKFSASQIEENCASCHARREELQGGFKAGDHFSDFFRLMLPDQTDLFYPDGQAKAEIFEYNSFQLSPMAHAGVRCVDCHNPHSGKLKLPVTNNALCLSCHQSPGTRGAIVIDPSSHTHHPEKSSGHQCVSCHMPAKPYMVRDLRRDHRFSIPDPLLTKEHQIPNACNACHQDKFIEWAIQKTSTWYGKKMERPSRQRTRALARAQAGDLKAGDTLLNLAQTEKNPAWRATLIAHLTPWLGNPKVEDFVKKSLGHSSPWVRSAAINVLKFTPEGWEALKKLKQDPARLVRLDAAWALAIQGRISPQEKTELMNYLNYHADQPTGVLKLGQLALAEYQLFEATSWIQKAINWDPGSAYPQYLMARTLYGLNRLREAQPYFEKAIQLDPNNFDYTYNLALLLGELGEKQTSLKWLEKTVELAPNFGRAWFNLGVLYLQEEQLGKAKSAMEKAKVLLPHSLDVAQVLAEINRRQEKINKAKKNMKNSKDSFLDCGCC